MLQCKRMTRTDDPVVADLLHQELERQQSTITLIPSENHTSSDVLSALGTVLSDKYAEGYPGKRYYAGNHVVDQVETLAQDRAKELFQVPYVNVQPYSGSPANLAIYFSVMNKDDTVMGLDLSNGGHITHGYKLSITGQMWKSCHYQLTADGRFDFDAIRDMAIQEKPKMIICGGTAVPRIVEFQRFAEIADEVGAYLLGDISHIAGLIAGGAHPSPVPHCHLLMTTTHKTLRGPRGALIMVTPKGLEKDPQLPAKLDRAIIPGLQGGPHMNSIAGIAIALREAAQPPFQEYATQTVANAQALAARLTQDGFRLVTGGTDNHLILIDLSSEGPGRGVLYHLALERIGLITNKNTVPQEPASPFYPSGLRIGTPAATSRGMKEPQMVQIGRWIHRVSQHIRSVTLPFGEGTTPQDRRKALSDFKATFETDAFYADLRREVETLCQGFPLPSTPSC
eukprot:gnl/Trimastix_PCT/2290.p1 GENE.gnl/Trimastix_PCT/2290~~gnl/Trimastix_PCT/2290.p1  ORF type:complete len:454 (-),score=135.85 gnl/Trimastix_PCT/2290:591-1952(-)